MRSIAPRDTIGGGAIVDPSARRHGPGDALVAQLERLRRGELEPESVAPASTALAAAPPLVTPAALALEQRLRDAGHEPPNDAELGDVAAELAALRAAGRAVRLGRGMHIHPDSLAGVRREVERIVDSEGAVTLARLRDELGTSRKYAQALLEALDAARVTLRLPDERRVLRRRTPGQC